MTEKVVVDVSHISKIYKIFDKPTDRIKEALHPFHRRYSKDFAALQDISFQAWRGETLGIIGRNGAGKSTLLKLITGVLTPTCGHIQIHGRVASLLELGAGFNPEMTGVENVYLNGSIAGYSKAQMEERISEIIQFADIGDFIYQPVKMYSSGMFARLAFAANMAVDPDILIVDEALSVGDIAFQYKCFQKMKEIKERGTTILLVTHSTQQILQNSDRVILLDHGKMLLDTRDVKAGIASYEKIIRNVRADDAEKEAPPLEEYADDSSICAQPFDTRPNTALCEHRMGSYRAVIDAACIADRPYVMQPLKLIEAGSRKYLNFRIFSHEDIPDVVLGFSLRSKEGVDLWGDNNLTSDMPIRLHPGVNYISYEFEMHLNHGQYLLCPGIAVCLPSGKREELDQRWPLAIVDVVTNQGAVGFVFSPVRVLPVKHR